MQTLRKLVLTALVLCAATVISTGQAFAEEGKCGADKKCGEGKCGGDKAKDAATDAAEGKCGADKAKDATDKKCGADKKCGEGKCGEGKE